MSIKYYKLFDLLNRRGMKKSDLRKILSTNTVAKLSKGEYLSGEVIEKICVFLNCQPGDIMEVVYDEGVADDGSSMYKTNVIEDTVYVQNEDRLTDIGRTITKITEPNNGIKITDISEAKEI